MGTEEVKNEVTEMNNAFQGILSGEEDEKKEDELSDEVENDEDESKKDDEEKPNEEDQEIEDKKDGVEDEVDKKDDEGEEDKEDEKDKIIAELRKKLNEKEEVKEEESKTEEAKEETFEEQNFIDEDENLEYLSNEPEKFNKLLNKVYQQTVINTRKTLGESILRAIPDIVKANVIAITNLHRASDEFYNENKDLKPFKKVVASVLEEMMSDNSGKTYNELLPKVGDEVRKRLELHKKTSDSGKSPRLPRKKGKSTVSELKPSTSKLADELNSMNSALRR